MAHNNLIKFKAFIVEIDFIETIIVTNKILYSLIIFKYASCVCKK